MDNAYLELKTFLLILQGCSLGGKQEARTSSGTPLWNKYKSGKWINKYIGRGQLFSKIDIAKAYLQMNIEEIPRYF